jgi:myosin heavy subunit
LIEGKGGLLLMLDDATMGVKQTDLQFVDKVIKAHDKHAKFFKPKFVKDAPLQFGVKHYAGDVMYTAEQVINKNVATQPPEVVELMESSSLEVLKGLADRDGGPQHGAVKTKTVGGGFRKSLQTLIEKLNASEAHFVRCVKPNKEKKPGIFDALMIVDQLRLSGVTETVKIRKSGFLMRPPALEFLQRFLIILDKETKKQVCRSSGSSKDSHAMPGTDLVKCSKALIAEMPSRVQNFNKDEIVVGKTKVFIKAELYRYLEEARREAFIPPTMLIQRIWRGHRTRVIMKEVL